MRVLKTIPGVIATAAVLAGCSSGATLAETGGSALDTIHRAIGAPTVNEISLDTLETAKISIAEFTTGITEAGDLTDVLDYSHDDAVSAFLRMAYANDELTALDDDLLLRAGQEVCAAIDGGETLESVLERHLVVLGDEGVSLFNAGTYFLCPIHRLEYRLHLEPNALVEN